MSRETTRRRVLGGGAAAALTAIAGCVGATPFVGQRLEDSETLPADDVDRVSIETRSGGVTVRPSDREDIHVDIVKQSSSVTADVSDLAFRTERDDGHLRMFPEWTGRDPIFGDVPGMELHVTLPPHVAVERIDGSVGSVDVAGTTGDLTISTSTGSIDVRDVDGDVNASSSTGGIDVANVTGTASASATTGSVTVRDPGRLGDVSTSTGSIDVQVPALDDDVRVQATTGSVTAALAADLDADLHVTTSTGSIAVEDLDVHSEIGDSDVLVGTLNDGGQSLRIETSTGSVRLERLA